MAFTDVAEKYKQRVVVIKNSVFSLTGRILRDARERMKRLNAAWHIKLASIYSLYLKHI
jgi:hypothetical protein